jgi:hypothetical protein
MNYDQNDCPTIFFHNPTCRHTKNKSWRRCRLYFRGRMHCRWSFDFETDYIYIIDGDKTIIGFVGFVANLLNRPADGVRKTIDKIKYYVLILSMRKTYLDICRKSKVTTH